MYMYKLDSTDCCVNRVRESNSSICTGFSHSIGYFLPQLFHHNAIVMIPVLDLPRTHQDLHFTGSSLGQDHRILGGKQTGMTCNYIVPVFIPSTSYASFLSNERPVRCAAVANAIRNNVDMFDSRLFNISLLVILVDR
jgi:hypothetical protein